MSNLSKKYDVPKIHFYVVNALDEFGKQKWGMGGCLFKGRNYRIYYSPPAKLESGGHTYPAWIAVSNKGVLYLKKSGPSGKDVYKYPGYRVTLNLFDLELSPDADAHFMVEYGGYYDDTFGVDNVHSDIISIEVSEVALKQTLSEILARGYEPCTVLSWQLGSQHYKQVR